MERYFKKQLVNRLLSILIASLFLLLTISHVNLLGVVEFVFLMKRIILRLTFVRDRIGRGVSKDKQTKQVLNPKSATPTS